MILGRQQLSLLLRLFVVAGFFVASSALAQQGFWRLDVTGDSVTVTAGGTATLRATVRNTSSENLEGTLIIGASMEDATFESVTSSHPALICSKVAGTQNSHRCIGIVTMAPNEAITVTAIARIASTLLPDENVTFVASASGFGSFASGLFRMKIGPGRGVDLQPEVTSLSSAILEIEIGPHGEIAGATSFEHVLGTYEHVPRSRALLLRVDVANVGDAVNQGVFQVQILGRFGSELKHIVGNWPQCGDFPNWTHRSIRQIPPGGKISLCQAFRVDFANTQLVAKTMSIEDRNATNDESISVPITTDLPRVFVGHVLNDAPPLILRTSGRQ